MNLSLPVPTTRILLNIIEEDEKFLENLVDQVIFKLKQESDYTVPPDCRGFVERILRSKDYSVPRAAKLILCFRNAINSIYDMFLHYRPKLCEPLFLSGVMTLLKSRDEWGRSIILTRFGQWIPSECEYDQAITGLMLLFSWVTAQSHQTQRKGIVYLLDLRNFGLEQLRGVKMSRLKQLITLTHDSSPGRLSGVHFVFHARIFGLLFQVVKPFIKEKLSKRIYFHGDDLKKLHQYLKPEILPKSLGGNLDEEECVDWDLLERFLKEEGLQKELLANGIPKY